MTNISKARTRGKFQILCSLSIFAIFWWGCVGLVPAWAQMALSEPDLARFGRAASLNNLKRHAESVDILKDLYALYPDHRDILAEWIKALVNTGEAERAQKLFKEYQARHPQDKEFDKVFASLLEANQKFEMSRSQYLELLASSPQDKEILGKVADLSLWLKDYAASSEYFMRVLEQDPQDKAAALKLAESLFFLEDYEPAVKYYKMSGLVPDGKKVEFLHFCSSLMALEYYEEAVEAYGQMLAAHSDCLEAKVGLADALSALGRKEEAEKLFEEIVTAHPEDDEAMLKLADILAVKKYDEKAVEVYRKILAADPGNKDVRLRVARLLSWMKMYEEAVREYEQLIAQAPDWLLPRQELARVHGWRREYQQAMTVYQQAVRDIGGQDALVNEMRAKHAYFRRFDKTAIKNYNTWVSQEPDNIEAWSDLAQVYARNAQWQNARQGFSEILRRFPDHAQALQGQARAELYAESFLAQGRFDSFEADSAARDTDVKYYGFSTRLTRPVTEPLSLEINEASLFYSFPQDPASVYRQSIGMGLRYQDRPEWQAEAGYAFNIYSDDLDESHTFFEQAQWQVWDAFRLLLGHRRDDVIENVETLKAGLWKDDYRAQGVYEPHRRLRLAADYTFSDYDDGNDKYLWGVDLAAMLHAEPRRLSLLYRFEQYGFDEPSSLYFSPDSFHLHSFGFEWEHFLNEEELSWGSRDTYYTFRYLVNLDVGGEHGHTVFFRFHKDITNRLFFNVEMSKKIYEHQDVYGENRITANAGIYF